ncbi:hypothetical protein ACTXNW_12505 [Enterococcus malodoratus]|uniref:hypothetical protein n=1 Tax=Enterococcus malodoratus TaxID=71451 RepID=UPI0005586979
MEKGYAVAYPFFGQFLMLNDEGSFKNVTANKDLNLNFEVLFTKKNRIWIKPIRHNLIKKLGSYSDEKACVLTTKNVILISYVAVK